MDVSDIRRLHLLWVKIYPYLAEQVRSILPEGARMLLEIGPFSGGIAFELAEGRRDYSIVIADTRQKLLDHLRREARDRNLLDQIQLQRTLLSPLRFGDHEFDAVISRGAFFFLDESLLKEIHRVLKPGGIGFIGGGFGASTPRNLIDEIAPESRRINRKLGKKWISRTDVGKMVAEADLEHCSRVIEAGGLWVLLTK